MSVGQLTDNAAKAVLNSLYENELRIARAAQEQYPEEFAEDCASCRIEATPEAMASFNVQECAQFGGTLFYEQYILPALEEVWKQDERNQHKGGL